LAALRRTFFAAIGGGLAFARLRVTSTSVTGERGDTVTFTGLLLAFSAVVAAFTRLALARAWAAALDSSACSSKPDPAFFAAARFAFALATYSRNVAAIRSSSASARGS
jgi:hypothetical protein